jgi:hypothetical protein
MTDDREVVEGFYSGAEAQDDDAEDEGFDKVSVNLSHNSRSNSRRMQWMQ